VGDGVGEGVGEGVGDGDGEGLGEGVGEGVGDGDGEGLGEGVGEGVGDGDGEGLGEGVGDGEGEGLGDGDGEGGDGEVPWSAWVIRKVDDELVALARPISLLLRAWISESVRPNRRFSWDGSSRSICRVGDSWASALKNIRSCVDSTGSLLSADRSGLTVGHLEAELP
jgi:hypothetical protein